MSAETYIDDSGTLIRGIIYAHNYIYGFDALSLSSHVNDEDLGASAGNAGQAGLVIDIRADDTCNFAAMSDIVVRIIDIPETEFFAVIVGYALILHKTALQVSMGESRTCIDNRHQHLLIVRKRCVSKLRPGTGRVDTSCVIFIFQGISLKIILQSFDVFRIIGILRLVQQFIFIVRLYEQDLFL